MIILEHSAFDTDSIAHHLGAPDYSYWFVRKAFRRILERFGIAISVDDPAHEVDRIYRNAALHDESSVYLSFNPPHSTVLGLRCPTVPVFAWEFDTIPYETWQDDPRHDWTFVLKQVPAAITHSQFAARTVRKTLGDSYPIWSIPAPVYEANSKRIDSAKGWHDAVKLTIGGFVIDANSVDLSLFSVQRARTDGARALLALCSKITEPGHRPRELTLNGVVYTAVFNPADARKNWNTLLAGFIYAFKDNPEATLLVKVTHHDAILGALPILSSLSKLGAFQCRVLVIHGLIPEEEYASLVHATSYIVNTSAGEGQCLPLMEFMSAGRPAIASQHTAMLDYATAENSFLVPTMMKPASWPHDPRQAIRCLHHIVRFGELVRCLRASFEIAKERPQQYAAMSVAATTALRRYCSDDVVTERLHEVLRHLQLSSDRRSSMLARFRRKRAVI